MENHIFAFFARTEGGALGVIDTSSEEGWKRKLTTTFSVNDAQVSLINQKDWLPPELKSKTAEELDSKYPQVRLVIHKVLQARGVPSSALQNLSDKIKVSQNPISGLVVFAFLYAGELSKAETLSLEDIQVTFFNAVDSSDANLAETLINRGADVNKTDEKGFLPLWTAMTKNKINMQLIKLLINKGTNPNNASNGITSLIVAAKFGLIDVVRLLLEAGADVSLKDHAGRTALDHARQSGNREMINILTSSPQKPAKSTIAIKEQSATQKAETTMSTAKPLEEKKKWWQFWK